MIHYPKMNVIAFHLGPLPVHWYGLMYLFGFISVWILALWRVKRFAYPLTSSQMADLIFYGALGVLLGGRIGFMIFYDLPVLISHPLSMVKVWDGGMSFHGGLIGCTIGLWLFVRKFKLKLLIVTDLVAPMVPIALAFGRIGNFINGELWGRVSNVPWAMIFPNAGPLPRHPSQIYEFFLEGCLLFIILWCYSLKPRPIGAVSGLFLVGYGCFRFFLEFFRQPDIQLGFVAWGWLTRGQELCVPMVIIGIILMIYAYKKGDIIEKRSFHRSHNSGVSL